MVKLSIAKSLPNPWGLLPKSFDTRQFGNLLLSVTTQDEFFELLSSYSCPSDRHHSLRFVCDASQRIELVAYPALPSEPILVQLDKPILLDRASKAHVNIHIPLNLKLLRTSGKSEDLIPVFELGCFANHTAWHGKPEAGELVHWMSHQEPETRNEETLRDTTYSQYASAKLSISLVNESVSAAQVDRILVRPEMTGMSLVDDGFLADAIKVALVDHQGEVYRFEQSLKAPRSQVGTRLKKGRPVEAAGLARESLKKVLSGPPSWFGVER